MPKRGERVSGKPLFELPPELQDTLDNGLNLVENIDEVNRLLTENGRPNLIIKNPIFLTPVESPIDITMMGSANDLRDSTGDFFEAPNTRMGNNFYRIFRIPGPNGTIPLNNKADLLKWEARFYEPKVSMVFPGVRPALERMIHLPLLKDFTEDLIIKMGGSDHAVLKRRHAKRLYVANVIMSNGLVDAGDDGVIGDDGILNDRYLIN
jgi:hypothetical protein